MSATAVTVPPMTSPGTPTEPSEHSAGSAGMTGRAAAVALAVVLSASFMDLQDATLITVAAPSLAADLGAGPTQVQWLLAANTIALAAGLVTGGRLGDDHGRRRVFLAGLAAFALASAACALASGPEVLVATRVVQGLAGGLMVPQVFGIIRSSFPPAVRARAFSAYGAVVSLAAVAAPLLGGLLVDADLFGLGWRTVFWVNVPVALVALLIGLRVLPESRDTRRSALDVPGAALLTTAVVLVLLPLVQGRTWGWPWWSHVLAAAGVGVLGVFLAHERRVAARGRQPVLDPSLLRIRSFTAGLLASVFFFGAIGAFFLTLSIYLQSGTGRSAWRTGLVVLPYAVGSVLTSGVGIALAARAGRALLVTGALTLAAAQAAMWWLVRGGQEPGYWALATVLLVGGLGLGLTAPILLDVVLAGVPGRDAGSAGGVLSTVNEIGGAAGVAVLGTVFFATLDDARDAVTAQPFGDALAAVMVWQVALYLLAAALMVLLPRAATRDGEDRAPSDALQTPA